MLDEMFPLIPIKVQGPSIPINSDPRVKGHETAHSTTATWLHKHLLRSLYQRLRTMQTFYLCSRSYVVILAESQRVGGG